MTVRGKDRPQAKGGSAWTWIAAGIAVLFVQVVLTASGAATEDSPVLTLLAAALVVVGLVRGAMDWLNRRGR